MKYLLNYYQAGKVCGGAELQNGGKVVIGRAEDVGLRIVNEPILGRRHVEAGLDGDRVTVRRLAGSTNPVYHGGKEADAFTLKVGDSFVVGATQFRLLRQAGEEAGKTPSTPGYSATLSGTEIYSMGDANDRLLLTSILELPEIMRVKQREDFYTYIANLLRIGSGGKWACVTDKEGIILAEDAGGLISPGSRISRTLLRKAVESAPCPTVYCWSQAGQADVATIQADVEWAIAAAAKMPSSAFLVFYVAGSDEICPDPKRHKKDAARFVGLVADMVGRAVALEKMEILEGHMERFFSGKIAEKLMSPLGMAELAPKVTQSSVMFFDIRGFSKKTEGKAEKILEHLNDLKKVMTAMTEIAHEEGGVVLQYQGDGMLAAWNVPFEEKTYVTDACRAAMRMARTLGTIMPGWRCGIGMHTGEVVAGTVGSEQVSSYSVMGAVVNQASRIEGITKMVEVPLLVSRDVAELVSRDVAIPVRVGRFQPAGMTTHLDLYELTEPPADQKRIAVLEKALKEFEAGNWEAAYEMLDELPPRDRPARFLKALTEDYRRHPPKNWEGVIELSQK